jgi:hypothetical protein
MRTLVKLLIVERWGRLPSPKRVEHNYGTRIGLISIEVTRASVPGLFASLRTATLNLRFRRRERLSGKYRRSADSNAHPVKHRWLLPSNRELARVARHILSRQTMSVASARRLAAVRDHVIRDSRSFRSTTDMSVGTAYGETRFTPLRTRRLERVFPSLIMRTALPPRNAHLRSAC